MKPKNRKRRETSQESNARGPTGAERKLLVKRRWFLMGAIGLAGAGAAGLAAVTWNPQSTVSSEVDLVLYRDPGCGCCKKWADGLGRGFAVKVIPSNNLHQVRRQFGVPDDLAGCHTATVDGFLIEGHVPADDVRRLLRERPAGVLGLAVPGMPLGSPGMETDDATVEQYEVIAFGADGNRDVFARYN